MASDCKKGKIWPFRPRKMTFRAIQPNLSFDMWLISCQRSFIPKKKKSYWSVSEIDPSPPPLNLDGRTDRQTDRRTNDGQLGIRKAPLPDGTAELKTGIVGFRFHHRTSGLGNSNVCAAIVPFFSITLVSVCQLLPQCVINVCTPTTALKFCSYLNH